MSKLMCLPILLIITVHSWKFSTQIYTYCTFKDTRMSKGLGLCGMLATGHQDGTIWHMHPKKRATEQCFQIPLQEKTTTSKLATYMLSMANWPTHNLLANGTNLNKLAAVTFSVSHFLSMSIWKLWLRFPAASSCAESIHSLEWIRTGQQILWET